jgi:aminotransferase
MENIRFSVEPADRMKHLPKQFFASMVHKVGAKIAAGRDVINLGQGNPDLPTPSHIVNSLQEAAQRPSFHKYSPFSGYDFLKEAIAERYLTDYGVKLNPYTQVAILFGGKTGLVEISQILLNRGDVCLVPDPGYPDYWSGIALAGGKMVFMPLTQDNNFLPDYSRIPLQDAVNAKMMFINYPNNPTATTASLSFYNDTVEFAAKHNIVTVSDFAYGAVRFDGTRAVSFLEAPGAIDVGIEIYTLSKTYNMAGWRVGFALGNEKLIEYINLLQDHYYVSLFGAVQWAASEALKGPQDCVQQLVTTYESRRNAFYHALSEIGWHAKKPQGSFFCWLPIPKGYSSSTFADELLEKADVMVAPGIGFGTHGEGYVRVGLLSSEERLREAAERIGRLGLFDKGRS